MKTNVNIFNALNESFNKETQVKKQVFMESNKVTVKEADLNEDKLQAVYDSRNSFYGKAETDGNKLYSYGTLVAEIKDGKPVVYGLYSQTTTRHIKEWLKQNGFKAETSRQIMADYGEVNEAAPQPNQSGKLEQDVENKPEENKEEPTEEPTAEDKEGLTEEETVILPNAEPEVDYIINDVTVLDPVADGDVQAPDIDSLLTLVSESLKAEYGENWGRINVLSSRIDENSSFALVDIATAEIIKEFEEKGIQDAAIGKNLILENADKLVEFKVNGLNGITKYSKKSNDPQKAILEWIETEFLSEAKKEKEAAKEIEKAKNEKDTIDAYIAGKPELRMELANIDMFVKLGKEIKDNAMDDSIRDRMYAFATMLPHCIEVTNKEDKYELTFGNNDEIVERIFGKEWVKETTPDNTVVGLKERCYLRRWCEIY